MVFQVICNALIEKLLGIGRAADAVHHAHLGGPWKSQRAAERTIIGACRLS